MSEPWLTKREIAAELKVSTRTVERQRLPFMRVGGQNRYRLTESEDALRSRERISQVTNPQPPNVIQFPRRITDTGNSSEVPA
jgi:hypothetical protein